MARFFKNRFFIIMMSIAIFAVIFTTTISLMGKIDPLKDFLGTVSTPFRYVGIKIKESFDGFAKYFNTIDSLYEENKEMESYIEKLENQLSNSQAIEEENERLHQYLEIKKTYPDFKFIEALIVGKESDNCTTPA